MVKLPTDAWLTPPPQPTPLTMMTNMPNMPTPDQTNSATNDVICVQDPMPGIMGLALHQSWKPKVR